MRNYILSMFNSKNERSDFYFSAPESIKFPFPIEVFSKRFDKNDIEKSSENKRWKNVGKLFEDVDVITLSNFCKAEEYLIQPFYPKTIKFS